MVSLQGTSIIYHRAKKVRTDPKSPSLALDSESPKRFRGNGDGFPAPGLAFDEVAPATYCRTRPESDAKAGTSRADRKPDPFCLVMGEAQPSPQANLR